MRFEIMENISKHNIVKFLILIIFSFNLACIFVFSTQAIGFLYDGDYIFIFLINFLSSILINRIHKRKNMYLITQISLFSIISAILLEIFFLNIPNYSYSELGYSIKIFANLESHPYSFYYLIEIFILTNTSLACLKFLARLKNSSNSKFQIKYKYLIKVGFSLLLALILGSWWNLSVPYSGWLFFCPIASLLSVIFGFILLFIYLKYLNQCKLKINKNSNYFIKFDFIELKTIRNFGFKNFLKYTIYSNFLMVFGILFLFLIPNMFLSTMMDRLSVSFIYGSMLKYSIIFLIIIIINLMVIKYFEIKSLKLIKSFIIIYLLIAAIFSIIEFNLIDFSIPINLHDFLFNIILGVLFSTFSYYLISIFILRLNENYGNSFFIDIFWNLLPFLISITLDVGFSTDPTSLNLFKSLYIIFIIFGLTFIFIQLILRKKINNFKFGVSNER